MILARIGREYLAQIVAFVVTVADRLLTAGVLVRLWGAEGFAVWSVALSTAGMVTLFDFGLAAYYSNRLLFATEREDEALAQRIFAVGNGAVGFANLAGLAIVATCFLLSGTTVGAASSAGLFWIAAPVAAATAMRQSMAVVISLYRARQDYSRQLLLNALADGVRIAAMIAAAFAGAGIEGVAWIYLLSTLVAAVTLPILDVANRFPGYRYRPALPDRVEQAEAIKPSSLFWGQSGATALITFAPIFFLAGAGADSRTLAQFTLMRTLGNLARAVLQLFANVLGLEAARRVARRDMEGFLMVYRESSVFLAVQTAAAGGVVAALAKDFFGLWTGDALLFDAPLLWLAIGVPLLLPTLALALQFLTCANMPQSLMTGRIAQIALTMVFFFLLPVESAAMRMMAALAIGELAGFGWPVSRAISAINTALGMLFHLDLFWRALVSGLFCFAASSAASSVLDGAPAAIRLGGGLICGGAVAILVIGAFGMTRDRRYAVMSWASGR